MPANIDDEEYSLSLRSHSNTKAFMIIHEGVKQLMVPSEDGEVSPRQESEIKNARMALQGGYYRTSMFI